MIKHNFWSRKGREAEFTLEGRKIKARERGFPKVRILRRMIGRKLDVTDRKSLFIAYVGAIWLAVMLYNRFGTAEIGATVFFMCCVAVVNFYHPQMKGRRRR